jgi:hypothetical protein
MITLSRALGITDNEIAIGKLELNMTVGRGGITYLEKWLRSNESDRIEGTTECSYWGWYGDQRNFTPNHLVFSFVQMDTNRWLFVSAAQINAVPEHSRATYMVIDKYKPYFGRVIIKHQKGNTFGRYVFDLSPRIEDCELIEILSSPYSGQQFEGYDNVHLDYRLCADVFKGKLMPTYHEALKKITGVYCLTDKVTGKLYIGSATGDGGVASRWGNYLDSKHGGNQKLIKLFNEKGEAYFEDNFTFTLLEYFGVSYDPVKIKLREQYWKKCLNTISCGYNDN